LEDQLGRFNIWASKLGVFADGTASLDHRLKKTPDVGDLVIRSLTTLLKHVEVGRSIFTIAILKTVLDCFATIIPAMLSVLLLFF